MGKELGFLRRDSRSPTWKARSRNESGANQKPQPAVAAVTDSGSNPALVAAAAAAAADDGAECDGLAAPLPTTVDEDSADDAADAAGVWSTPELMDAILEENFALRQQVKGHEDNIAKLKKVTFI